LAADVRFVGNADRVANRDALQTRIERIFATMPAVALIDRLDRAQIANGRMNTVAEFAAHPQLVARGRWRHVDSPVGPIAALVPPVNLEGTEPVMGPIPSVGQHSEAILRELGFTSDDVTGWRRVGAI
jgi:crotonobetainyl-CoA:carnitine CoA-transferase CaiB-like acyl-CoA transferase